MARDQTNSKAFCIGKTPLSTVTRHLLTQKVRLLLTSIKTTEDWLCGKAIYKDKNYYLINIADACFRFQGLSCVLEVELFVKSHKRMKVILENYIKDMSSDQYGKPLLDRVYYFTPHVDLIKQLVDQYVPAGLRNRFVVIQLNTNVYPYRSPNKTVGTIKPKKGDGSNA